MNCNRGTLRRYSFFLFDQRVTAVWFSFAALRGAAPLSPSVTKVLGNRLLSVPNKLTISLSPSARVEEPSTEL